MGTRVTPLPAALSALLLALALTAAAFDIRYRRIPNWLVVTGATAAFAIHIWLSGFNGFKTAAAGLGVAFLVYLPLFVLRAMGAGDVKLMAAIGAVIGPMNWIFLFVFTALLGGVAALVLVLAKGRLGETLRNVGVILSELAHFRAPHEKDVALDVRHANAITLPHGVVIAAACLLFLYLARGL